METIAILQPNVCALVEVGLPKEYQRGSGCETASIIENWGQSHYEKWKVV